MANAYYTHTTYPGTNSQGASASMRAELDAVMAGFTLLPDPLGSGQKGFNGGQFNSPNIVGGLIDNVTLGGVTPGPASFTTLQANGDITRDGLPTTNRAINFMSNGVKRASLYVSATETGSNAGSDIFLQTFSDAGALIATALKIQRSNSAVTFAGGITAPSLDGAAIGGVTRAAGSFTALDANGTLNVSGAASFGARIGLTANTPVLDFTDLGQSPPNGRFRLYTAANIFGLMKNTATAGDFSAFTTLMYFDASGRGFFNARPSFNGATPWDSSNLPNPATTSGGVTSGAQSFAGMVTFNGGATLNTQDGTYSEPLIFQSNAFTPRMRANTANSTLEFINSANSAMNMGLSDSGTLILPFARPTWLGLLPWDSGNLPNPAQTTGTTFSGSVQSSYTGGAGAFRVTVDTGHTFNTWNSTANYGLQIDAPNSSGAYGGVRWTRWAGRHLAAIDAFEGGSGSSQPTIVFHIANQNNAWTFNNVDILRGAGGFVWGTWNFDPNTKVQVRNFNNNRGFAMSNTSNDLIFNWEGSRTRMWVDGGNQGLLWTDANFDPGSKANNGSQCQHNSGIAESAAWAPGGGDNTVDMGNPWVAQGVRTISGPGWTWLRCVYLRNQ